MLGVKKKGKKSKKQTKKTGTESKQQKRLAMTKELLKESTNKMLEANISSGFKLDLYKTVVEFCQCDDN